MSETPKEVSVAETSYFTQDELAFSYKENYQTGKVYRAGSAFGIAPGMIEVIDMQTGESKIVPANASRRPASEDAT